MRLRVFAGPAMATVIATVFAVAAISAQTTPTTARPPLETEPLTIGETFTMRSDVLGETRRINVYAARGAAPVTALPVLYMPDGGVAEDFLHVAGLLQVSVGNGTMRPFLLVGIENTERRRDMTGPTTSAEDRRIAPRVGGSAAFRTFLRRELMPTITSRYRTTGETAIVGESLAGLFVVETFLLEPTLFDSYIAFDPSLWWNGGRLVQDAATLLAQPGRPASALFIAGSADMDSLVQAFGAVLRAHARPALRWQAIAMPEESHGTIYHPAALRAFRTLFRPVPSAPKSPH